MTKPKVPAPMTEPAIVHCHFLEGVEIERGGDFLRMVGWIYLTTGEETHPERRIVARAAMPMRVARELAGALRKSTRRQRT